MFRVKYSYDAQEEDELNLEVGDLIVNIIDIEEGCAKGTLKRTNQTGVFPINFGNFSIE